MYQSKPKQEKNILDWMNDEDFNAPLLNEKLDRFLSKEEDGDLMLIDPASVVTSAMPSTANTQKNVDNDEPVTTRRPADILLPLFEQMTKGEELAALGTIRALSLGELQQFPATNADHLTLIHYATKLGSDLLVAALLEKGLSAQDQDKFGSTPLHYAAVYQNDIIARRLISHSNNPQNTVNAIMSQYTLAAAALRDADSKLRDALAKKIDPSWIPLHKASITFWRAKILVLTNPNLVVHNLPPVSQSLHLNSTQSQAFGASAHQNITNNNSNNNNNNRPW